MRVFAQRNGVFTLQNEYPDNVAGGVPVRSIGDLMPGWHGDPLPWLRRRRR